MSSADKALEAIRERYRQQRAPRPVWIPLDGKTMPHGEQYMYVRLDPGDGVILRCRACGAFAYSRDLPDPAAAGYPGKPRYITGDGWEWQRAHVCDPARRRKVAMAGGDPLIFGRVPFYRDELTGQYIF